MKLSKKIIYELKYLGVSQDKRLDYYLKKLINDKTGFDMEDIELIEVAKLNIKQENEFNYFDFLYKRKRYILKNNDLKCYNDIRKVV